jgi:hypothetical protein
MLLKVGSRGDDVIKVQTRFKVPIVVSRLVLAIPFAQHHG